jgi:sialate O-acetylesterase
MPASETAYQMTFAGDDNFSFNNILIGDVWICSGQSNMEWPVRKVFNSAYELAKADIPAIRSFTVPNEISLTPQSDFSSGRWNVATYENAANISAVAYFFAKNLYQTEKIPIGLICSYWGGTAVEAWTSLESISSHPDYAQPVEKLLATKNTPDFFDSLRIKSKDAYQQWQEKIKSIDPGYKEKWYSPEYQANEWFSMLAPAYWEDNGLADFDGVVWLRKDVYIPSQMLGKPLQLDMEILKDYDTTWFNGEEIGFTSWNAGRRIYTVPAGLIREGKNTIVVRLENIKGSGGFSSKHDSELYIKELMADKQALNIPLSGLWQFKPAMRTGDYPAKPQDLTSIHTPSCLYNAKIAPLTNLSVKGAIWYQGETNAFRACQYRSLFPLLISDWRKQFRQDFPFLFVQLAGHKAITKEPVEETWAELREAQTMTLSVPQTGMAVAIDLGDPSDVHPTHKQEVGRRLALEAEKIAYHKPEIITSPLYQKMQIEGNKIRLYFSGSDNGLIAKNGKLSGFAIADDSKKFVWANAEIEGNTVVVWNDNIQNPAAVRYAYAGSPVEGNGANLYNKERFPASPFRTDDWEWITLNNK